MPLVEVEIFYSTFECWSPTCGRKQIVKSYKSFVFLSILCYFRLLTTIVYTRFHTTIFGIRNWFNLGSVRFPFLLIIL